MNIPNYLILLIAIVIYSSMLSLKTRDFCLDEHATLRATSLWDYYTDPCDSLPHNCSSA